MRDSITILLWILLFKRNISGKKKSQIRECDSKQKDRKIIVNSTPFEKKEDIIEKPQ